MKKQESRNIGLNLMPPKQKCEDKNCPFHGTIGVRGRKLTGTVTSTRMRRTAVIEFSRLYFLPKYERYEKRTSKLKVHNPDCINAKEGNIVNVMECRPLSKTKNFIIVQDLGMEKGFKEKMEAREASKKAPVKTEEKEKTEESEEQ